MEQANNENKKEECYCPLCHGPRGRWDCACGYGHMHIHRYFWLRLIIAIVVAFVIFLAGVRIGEFVAALRGNSWGHYGLGYSYMMRDYGYPTCYYSGTSGGGSYAVPMMLNNYGSGTSTIK
ncbi:hypothetical protein M1295_00515 [Patescibacteria group bacterium]|nr:hypothetical protein [Patescibacteria group bacterium]